MKLESSPADKADCLAPVIGELLSLRQRFRGNKQWKEADAIRKSLELADVIIEDTEEGSRWRLRS
jgi:cysteinyl-tRNA synthetase